MSYNWQYIISNIDGNHVPLKPFWRKSDVEETYNKHKHELQSNNIGIAEYVSKTYLCGKNTNIVSNEFPYDITDDIGHYVLWSREPLDAAQIHTFLMVNMYTSEFVWFENPIQYKSIPEVWHCHVMCRTV